MSARRDRWAADKHDVLVADETDAGLLAGTYARCHPTGGPHGPSAQRLTASRHPLPNARRLTQDVFGDVPLVGVPLPTSAAAQTKARIGGHGLLLYA